MKLFEVKNDIVTINIDTNFLKKYNKMNKKGIGYEEYNEYLSEKVKNGNQDAIIKSINIIKKLLVKNGCSNYEEFKKKEELIPKEFVK